MRYFLKKTNLKKGEYLQIYMSEYKRGIGSRNKSFKALGYTEELKGKGIKDPVGHFQREVDRMNSQLERKDAEDKALEIGNESPIRYLGYFPLKGIVNSLVFFEKAVDAIAQGRKFQFDVYETMMALVYARAILPSSKKKTHEEVIPLTFEKIDSVSYQQVLACCEYIGQEYKKIVSFLTNSVKKVYGLDFKHSYFDCTNFYFEIDKEDDWRRKGPSKENKKDPIISMGLLLDANQIPSGMSIFKGNESEKPQLRSVIGELKKENNISGRTIQVADKGLNCAKNIHKVLKNGDGYLFPKSLKKESDKEIEWFFSLDKDTWAHVYEEDEKRKNKELKYSYYCFEGDLTYDYVDDYGSTEEFTTREKRVITFSPKLT